MTFEELKLNSKDIANRIKLLENYLNIDQKKIEFQEIEKKMSAPDFWDNKENAQNTMACLSKCKNTIEKFESLRKEYEDYAALLELIDESADASHELLAEAEETCKKLLKHTEEAELMSFLSGKFDANNAYFSIHAGAGGTESCDWTAMLLRMYRRWFERRGFKDEIIDMQPGEEAGIKSVTLYVQGDYFYGYAKAEKGIHRLVRISPFDSNARRHTSFASVDVFPEIDDDINITIEEKDLRIDTYRASGAGGQYVNTTDSAVRITHLPTGITVACQCERSQHQNRATAMKMLKAKLYELEQMKQREEAEKIRGEKTDMGWGNQIRSYVLQPYQMVKDLRTGVETSNTTAVLDGDIDMFVTAWLKSGQKQQNN